MEPCIVPELLEIFTKIVRARKPYCYICLRTSDERRLVEPKSFKNFVSAIQMSAKNNLINSCHTICHICERQSYNALKLFRGAAFASSLNVIVQELCSRDIINTHIMFEPAYFKRILNKCNMSKSLTPKAIDEELRIIRTNSELSETDTLVMDNSQIYEAAPMPTVVAITTGQADMNNTEVIQQAIIQCPILPNTCNTQTILPDRVVTAAEIMQNKIPQSPETYVILDDEDDPLRTINLNSQTNNLPPTQPVVVPQPKQPILQPNLNINSNLVVTTEPPSIMTFQELLEQPKQKNINFLLHPIFLAPNGNLNIPSLSATITNGFLVFQNTTNATNTSKPLGINTEIIKQNLLLNKEVFLQSGNTATTANNSNVTDDSCQSETSNDVEKEMETWPKKRIRKSQNFVKNVQISDITSDMDSTVHSIKTGQAKTDWEDKIPMDVISFVDAVDPNADEVLKPRAPSGSNMMQVGDVRSLATEIKSEEIIDLC